MSTLVSVVCDHVWAVAAAAVVDVDDDVEMVLVGLPMVSNHSQNDPWIMVDWPNDNGHHHDDVCQTIYSHCIWVRRYLWSGRFSVRNDRCDFDQRSYFSQRPHLDR